MHFNILLQHSHLEVLANKKGVEVERGEEYDSSLNRLFVRVPYIVSSEHLITQARNR